MLPTRFLHVSLHFLNVILGICVPSLYALFLAGHPQPPEPVSFPRSSAETELFALTMQTNGLKFTGDKQNVTSC